MKIDRPTLYYADTLEPINTARGRDVLDVAPNEGVRTSNMLTLYMVVRVFVCASTQCQWITRTAPSRFCFAESGSPSAASEPQHFPLLHH